MQDVKLCEIDQEPWKYTLYESSVGELFVEIVYNPVSFADALLLIQLTENEQQIARSDRDRFVELIDDIRHEFTGYLHRKVDPQNFRFVEKKEK